MRIVKQLDGRYVSITTYQDGSEVSYHKDLESAVARTIDDAKCWCNATIDRTQIAYYQETPVVEIQIVPWVPELMPSWRNDND